MEDKSKKYGANKMVIIEVAEKDLDAVFEILSNNGRFAGLPNNRFRIDEHADEVLEKIKKAGIEVKIIDKKEK